MNRPRSYPSPELAELLDRLSPACRRHVESTLWELNQAIQTDLRPQPKRTFTPMEPVSFDADACGDSGVGYGGLEHDPDLLLTQAGKLMQWSQNCCVVFFFASVTLIKLLGTFHRDERRDVVFNDRWHEAGSLRRESAHMVTWS